MTSSCIFTFKTVQTNAIRILFESLKNIVSDVTFSITEKGIKLTTIDGTSKAIIDLKLYHDKFEYFECNSDTDISVNLTSIFKILKGIKHADTITFSMLNNDLDHILIITENSEKKSKIISKIKLLNSEESIYKIPDISYNSYMTMPSTDFQSYISELATISSKISFLTDGKCFKMNVKGDFAEQTIIIKENNTELEDQNEIDYGKFNIKYIQLFTKSTNLCGTIEIFLKPQYPLAIVYNVANLGSIKYCLAPENV